MSIANIFTDMRGFVTVSVSNMFTDLPGCANVPVANIFTDISEELSLLIFTVVQEW